MTNPQRRLQEARKQATIAAEELDGDAGIYASLTAENAQEALEVLEG